MKTRIALLSALTALSSIVAAAHAAAAPDPQGAQIRSAPPVARSASPGPWSIRAEASLVDMRDNWLGVPGPELGLTVGRDLFSRLSIELTGASHDPGTEHHSWSAMAAARGVIVANPTGRHALTIAGGPLFEINNRVHGDMPFAHTEMAYVYRAPFGLTMLAGGGLNFALATSRYVEPPPIECQNQGDAVVLCIDLGPDAREIHAGDATVHARVAVGWQF
jgi:hypothetical protein